MDDEEPDILFLAVTQPTMKYGVPYEGFMANVLITFVFGMVMGSPLWWAAGFGVHWPMRLLTSRDHNVFRVLSLWMQTKAASTGRDTKGCSSFAPISSVKPRRSEEIPFSV